MMWPTCYPCTCLGAMRQYFISFFICMALESLGGSEVFLWYLSGFWARYVGLKFLGFKLAGFVVCLGIAPEP